MINAPTGSGYSGQVLERLNSIKLVMSMPIASVTYSVGDGSAAIAGPPLQYCRFEDTNSGCFGYDGESATAIVSLPLAPTLSSVVVQITLIAPQDDASLARAKGIATRTLLGKRVLDDYRETPYSTVQGSGMLKQVASRAMHLTYLAGTNSAQFLALVGAPYSQLLQDAVREVQTMVSSISEAGQAVVQLLSTL